MGRHLNVDRWFDKMPTTGNLRRKRVSAKMEEQFPLHLRGIYQERGAAALVKFLTTTRNLSLSQAWAEVKRMFND